MSKNENWLCVACKKYLCTFNSEHVPQVVLRNLDIYLDLPPTSQLVNCFVVYEQVKQCSVKGGTAWKYVLQRKYAGLCLPLLVAVVWYCDSGGCELAMTKLLPKKLVVIYAWYSS